MHRLKVGLISAYFPNFDAVKLGVFKRSGDEMRALAARLDVELFVIEEGVQSRQEAEAAARQLQAESIDFLLIQVSSFTLGDVILPLVDVNARLGLWFLPEPSLAGDIPLNSLTGFNLFASIIRLHLRERNLPFKWFFGAAGDARFQRRLTITIRALDALKRLQQTRIGILGGAAPTFLNLEYDAAAIAGRLGVQIEEQPMGEVFGRVDDAGEDEVAAAVEMMTARAADVQVTGAWMKRTARVYLALRAWAQAGQYSAVGVRCWPEFQSELGGIGPCAALSWLNETGLPASCEGDALGALSMLASFYISRAPVTMTDLVAVAEEENLVQMWHCGPTAVSWADEAGQALTYHPTLDRASPPGAPKSGVSSDLVFAPGPVTVARFSQTAEQLFLMTADVVPGPSRGYAGSRGWLGNLRMAGQPLTIPDLIETIAFYGLEHHYPLARGDHSDIFLELAAWAGVRPLEPRRYHDYLVIPDL